VPTREVGVLLIRRTNDVVGGADRSVDIAQEGILEPLRLGELEVLGGRVERSSDDRAVGRFEPCGAVTQRLALDRSTRCRCLWVPPQQHPPTAEVGKAHVVTVLVGKAEVGSSSAGSNHLARLRAFWLVAFELREVVEAATIERSALEPPCR
jgi:hypothetical protein